MDERHTIGIFAGSTFSHSKNGVSKLDQMPTSDLEWQQSTILDELHSVANHLDPERFKLVYGGGNSGLMGVIPVGFSKRGGSVLGYNARMFADSADSGGAPNGSQIGLQIVCETFEERQLSLIRASDSILVLPGGVGTLYEVFDVLVRNDLRRWDDQRSRRVVLYNYRNYFKGLVGFIQNSTECGFIKQRVLDDLFVVNNPIELLETFDRLLLQDVQGTQI